MVVEVWFIRAFSQLEVIVEVETNQHNYEITVKWTGNQGRGTSAYNAYKRDHEIMVAGKQPILASSDPSFRGDSTRYNPEELLVASLSGCHMLWYLHLSAVAGIIVTGYVDEAIGSMVEQDHGGGCFTEVTLRPRVKIAAGADPELAMQLHEKAHQLCFVANSVNFPVRCEATVER